MANTSVSNTPATKGIDLVQTHKVAIDTADTYVLLRPLNASRTPYITGIVAPSIPVGTLTFCFVPSDSNAAATGAFEYAMTFAADTVFVALPKRGRADEFIFSGNAGDALWVKCSVAINFTLNTDAPTIGSAGD